MCNIKHALGLHQKKASGHEFFSLFFLRVSINIINSTKTVERPFKNVPSDFIQFQSIIVLLKCLSG